MRLNLAWASSLVFPLMAAAAAPSPTPLERYYYDRSADTSFAPIFDEQSRGKAGIRVFLVVGDLDQTIGIDTYRPDAVIVPTNTSAELQAGFPITQRVYVQRVRNSALASKTLEQVIEEARRKAGTYAFLPLGVGSVTATLPQPRNAIVPRSVCLLATDNRGGGSINQRDFFYQGRLARGVGDCLRALEATGARSIAMPLVGSALFATSDGSLDGDERGLVKCRMLNSVSGIAQALGGLPPTSKLRDVAIILWQHDMDRLFGTSRKDRRRSDFGSFAAQIKASLARGLARRPTTAKQVRLPQCEQIFGPAGLG
jgi:hypothetical protein